MARTTIGKRSTAVFVAAAAALALAAALLTTAAAAATQRGAVVKLGQSSLGQILVNS